MRICEFVTMDNDLFLPNLRVFSMQMSNIFDKNRILIEFIVFNVIAFLFLSFSFVFLDHLLDNGRSSTGGGATSIGCIEKSAETKFTDAIETKLCAQQKPGQKSRGHR